MRTPNARNRYQFVVVAVVVRGEKAGFDVWVEVSLQRLQGQSPSGAACTRASIRSRKVGAGVLAKKAPALSHSHQQ